MLELFLKSVTTSSVAQIFMDQIFRLHGIPSSIVSDRDATFTSHFWTELFRLTGTKLKMSSGYHPQTHGQIEVTNKCLETYLHCFTSEQQHQWEKWLPLVEWWYNTSYHTTSKMTPYEVVYGQPPPVLLPYTPIVHQFGLLTWLCETVIRFSTFCKRIFFWGTKPPLTSLITFMSVGNAVG